MRSQTVARVTGKTLAAALAEHVDTSATLNTDDYAAYRKPGRKYAAHHVVNHSTGEYVRGAAYTNTVEGYFSILKRGVVGTFHHLSKHHMPLYLAEFDHRYNTRKTSDGGAHGRRDPQGGGEAAHAPYASGRPAGATI